MMQRSVWEILSSSYVFDLSLFFDAATETGASQNEADRLLSERRRDHGVLGYLAATAEL
jgi:hypothetical protein